MSQNSTFTLDVKSYLDRNNINQKQEAIRAFGKGLVQGQDDSKNASKAIRNNSAEMAGNNPAIEYLYKEHGEEV